MSEEETLALDAMRADNEIDSMTVEDYQRHLAIAHAAMGDYQSMFEPIDVEEVVLSRKEERGGPPIKVPPGGLMGFHYADGVGVVGALHPQTPTSERGQKLLNELQEIVEANGVNPPTLDRALDILHELSELLRGEK